MKAKITIMFATLLLGAILGYFTQEWNERALPVLSISSVSFDKPKTKEVIIDIPNNLQEMTRKSRWYNSLDNKLPLLKLKKDLDDNLSETVVALERMTSVLPKMRKYLRKNQNNLSVNQAKDYRLFLSKNSDSLSLTYLTMSIVGLIKRNEVQLDIMEGVVKQSTFIPPGKKTLADVRSSFKSQKEQFAIVALQLVTDWHPKDMLKVLDIVIETTGEQATINRKIMDELSALVKSGVNQLSGDYLSVTANISNNGKNTISLQKYAIISLSGLEEPIFLELSDKSNGSITLSQGETKEINLKSRETLSSDLSNKLKTIYNTNFIKCKMAMRLLTPTNFSSEWTYSQITNISSFNEKLKLEYKDNAPVLE